MNVILHKKILRKLEFVLFAVKIMCFASGKRDAIEAFIMHFVYSCVCRVNSYYFENNRNNTVKKKRKILELRELEDTIEKYIEDNNYNINYSIEGCMLFCAYPEIEQEMNCLTAFDKEYYGCRAGKSKAEIYKDGRMLPCILFENINATYQKVNGENFQECWDNDPVFNIINKNKVNNKKCDLCGFSEICNGGCPADRIKKYGVNYNKDIICKK